MYVITSIFFFFFNQKTAYEMGISDWSSDVCSSDLLFLVLGDNLLFLYFGWEGVGLCSYLLIGFYYSNRNNGNAALKAFVVTRIGDVFMAIGLFILFQQ